MYKYVINLCANLRMIIKLVERSIMRQAYNTKQKQYILEVLNKAGRSLSVDEILIRLEHSDKKVSVATLYRYLEKYSADGLVRKIFNSQKNSYEFQLVLENKEQCEQHFHLKCTNCGKLIHLQCDDSKNFISHIGQEHGFKINQSMSTIFGICKDCL